MDVRQVELTRNIGQHFGITNIAFSGDATRGEPRDGEREYGKQLSHGNLLWGFLSPLYDVPYFDPGVKASMYKNTPLIRG